MIASTDEAAFAAITTVVGATLSVTNYVDGDLSDLTNNGTVNVTTADTAVLADDALSTASAISIGAGTASIIATADEAAFAAITTVASGATLSVTNYVDGDLSDLTTTVKCQCHHCQFSSPG